MFDKLFSRSSYYLNKKRYFGSCIFVLSIAFTIQLLLLLSNWNHFNLLYKILYSMFVLYARIFKSADLSHLKNNLSISQHHLCINLANQTVSCELVGYEILLSYTVPQWIVFKDSPSTFIPSIRQNEIAATLILSSPFGAIYETYTIYNLSCFLVHSDSKTNNLSEIYKNGVIIYFHGGAFVSGSAKVLHRFMTYLHLFTDLPILGVDYRLAPEYPLQSNAVLEDGYNIIINHLHEEMNVNLNSIYLIGDSAGGAICILLMQHLSIRGFNNIGGGVFISPGIDIDNNPQITPSLIENEKYDVFLSIEAIEFFKQFVFGCRDVNGNKVYQNITVTQCVDNQIIKMKKQLYNKESWRNMDNNTNMLFIACEYEILRDGIIHVYNMTTKFGINSQMYIIPKANIHALPVMVGAPEAIKAIADISHVIKTWKQNQKNE